MIVAALPRVATLFCVNDIWCFILSFDSVAPQCQLIQPCYASIVNRDNQMVIHRREREEIPCSSSKEAVRTQLFWLAR